jgi:hypothetical protein
MSITGMKSEKYFSTFSCSTLSRMHSTCLCGSLNPYLLVIIAGKEYETISLPLPQSCLKVPNNKS